MTLPLFSSWCWWLDCFLWNYEKWTCKWYWTNKTCDKLRFGGGFTAIIRMSSTACNRAEQGWANLVFETWEILIVVGNMIKWTVDVICRTLNSTNHAANQNQSGSVQLCGIRGMAVHAAGLPKFLPWKSLFIYYWPWWYFLSDVAAERMLASYSWVNSDT